ncbi:MAG: hypothetical protein AAF720_00690 [Pseudomonadota bacterium]
MPGKPQVSPQRLATMLDVLAKRPNFKGRVYLQPDGGVEICTTSEQSNTTDDKVNTNEKLGSDLTDEELAAFGSAA